MLFHGREVGFTDGLGWIYGMVRRYQLPQCREVGLTRQLFSCHGVVRSGLSDGLVIWFCHGGLRSVY